MSVKENNFEVKFPAVLALEVPTKRKADSLLKNSFTLSRSSNAESLSNIRMQTYTRLYSSKKFSIPIAPQGQSTARINQDSEIFPGITKEKKLNMTSISSKQLKSKPGTREFSKQSTACPAPTRKAENNEKKVKESMFEVQRVLSDKLELIRDLATYENDFSKTKELSISLGRLRMLSTSIPDIYGENEINQVEEKAILQKLNEGLDSILKMGAETKHLENEGNIENEIFDLKSSYQLRKFESVYQGIFKISSISCIMCLIKHFGELNNPVEISYSLSIRSKIQEHHIINFRSDKWLEYIEISVETSFGDAFNINVRVPISNSHQDKKQIYSYTKKSILPHLYFIYSNNELKLQYDYRHSHTFYSLICEIRGFGLCSVQLTESGDQQVHIQVSSIDDALEVPLSIITPKSSLFLENSDWIKRVVQKYLSYIPQMNGLYWQETDDQGYIFSQKEACSLLMNAEYLKEEFDILMFSEVYAFEIKLGNSIFNLQCFGSSQHVKFTAKYDNDVVDVSPESKSFKLLTDLQSLNLRKCTATLRNSLELELFFRKIFPKAFLCKNKEN
ncbi:unnamed protein product [Blepharisma stoltei]|uniref:Uncharacterized protein n=1 Tax=Blepharisma stoltei TaxID=1481888 RepID=A0AAU9INL5_9CILI|nr:unnamed protein product [Blepharisma stoltei]